MKTAKYANLSLRYAIKLACGLALGLIVGCTSTTTVTTTADTGSGNYQTPNKHGRNPTASMYNVQLGVAYMQQGDVQRAKKKLRLALQQDPNSSMALDAMALLLENTGSDHNAKQYYLRAIEAHPQEGSVHNNYGAYLCRKGQFDAANEQFMLAIQDPNYATPGRAYENAALCAQKMPDQKLAKAYFVKALQNDPKLPNSLLEMGEYSYEAKDYVRANNYLTRYAKYAKPTAQSLWLGIRVAKQLGDENTVSSDTLLLKHNFADSREYQEYLKWRSEPGVG